MSGPQMLYDDNPESVGYDDDIEDVSVPLDEEDFDFAEFVAGVHAARRRVRIYPNGHLLAEVEELLDQIEQADSDEAAEPLLARYEALNKRLRASVVVIVEGRSAERLRAVEKAAYREGVPEPAKITAKLAKSKLPEDHPQRAEMAARIDEGIQEVMLRQIADAIVHPTQGVTVEALRLLRDKASPEVDRLFRAFQQVNTQSVGVTPDFSLGRSGSRPAG